MGIEEFLNCAPMFLCFILIKMKEFCVTQNDTPKTGKKYVSTNKFSHVFKEHKPSSWIIPGSMFQSLFPALPCSLPWPTIFNICQCP